MTSFVSKLKNKLRRLLRRTDSTASSTSTDTEFTAEIVRVTRVLPHPNADRLEILRFEMKGIGETAYEVVSQKGTFSVGQTAAYFSVDCVLPTAHPDFEFLTKRPDGAGKTHFRLRAARLRGVFSQGLLVPCPAGMLFGEGCAAAFGVYYYQPPECGRPAAGIAKPAAKVNRQPFPVYGVDSLKKLPRLFEVGEPVVVTEKIHGTNFRFGWVRRKILGIPIGWKFVVGSHRVIKGASSDGHWYGEDLWSQAADKMALARKVWDYRGFTFYGELYGYTYSGQRIQDLTYGRTPEDGPGLACFDVRTPDGKWVDPFERECILADVDLPTVPFVSQTLWSPDLLAHAEGKSLLAPKQIREGVVIEDAYKPLFSARKTRRKAKFVGEGYLMRKEAE